jgi:hypothetical protein
MTNGGTMPRLLSSSQKTMGGNPKVPVTIMEAYNKAFNDGVAAAGRLVYSSMLGGDYVAVTARAEATLAKIKGLYRPDPRYSTGPDIGPQARPRTE